MKMTKRLADCLRRWGTVVRERPTVVTHLVYGTTTEVDPLTFAVYETCIKAVYACNQSSPLVELADCSWREFLEQGKRHYAAVAAKDGFRLPAITADTDPNRCHADYAYCRQLVVDAGLYHQLLD